MCKECGEPAIYWGDQFCSEPCAMKFSQAEFDQKMAGLKRSEIYQMPEDIGI